MSDKPTVQEAWAGVMAAVRALGKDQRVTSGPAKFNFRGVDDVMNAVGPALREHGVTVTPTSVDVTAEDVTTAKGSKMRNVTVIVTYAIHGPAGDTMPGAAAGEAADSGDKATPKAMSVAYRTFLLQALCLPTDEPDPDTHQYERAAGPSDADLAAEVVNNLAACTSEAEVREWGNKAHGRGLLDVTVGQQTVREHVQSHLTLFAKPAEQTEGVPA